MACLKNGVKLVCSVSENVSLALKQRRFSSATAASLMGKRGRGVEEKVVTAASGRSKEIAKEDSAICSWVPDPVTGYYRPANQVQDLDAAKLRRIYLSNKD